MQEEDLNSGAAGIQAVRIRGALPRKRRVNLAYVTRTRVPWGRILLGLLCAVGVCVLFVRWAVLNRFAALREARAALESVQEQYQQADETLNEYYKTRDVYVHVTWSNMTAEEIGLIDPIDVADLLERVVMPVSPLDGWSLSGNSVTLNIRTATLEQANDLAHQLRNEPMVRFCTIQAGDRSAAEDSGPSTVTSQIVIQFVAADNSRGTSGTGG